jgi:hypothetical protein
MKFYEGVCPLFPWSLFRTLSATPYSSPSFWWGAIRLGIPLSSVEAEGAQERGVVVFTLQQLPDDQPFYFDRKSRLTIARTGNNLYTINGACRNVVVFRFLLPSSSPRILSLAADECGLTFLWWDIFVQAKIFREQA